MSSEPSVDGYGAHDTQRLRGPDGDGDDPRSPFARDYDRLIYTAQFRRLQGKTQVVTAGEADFFRTRLTHTIEVAQVARRLAEAVNRRALRARKEAGTATKVDDPADVTQLAADQQYIDPDLCEAAAVLHDLGHPPYAHAGEQALLEAVDAAAEASGVAEVGGFEGNAQSFRLATGVLSHHGAARGLQLTHATLDACLKYPWIAGDADAPKPGKWSAYPTEAADLHEVRRRAPQALRYEASLEAQVMDWADDVAYSIHDLEDWYRAGYMPLPRLAMIDSEGDRFIEFVVEKWRDKDERADDVDALAARIRDEVLGPELTPLSGFRAAEVEGDRVDDPDSGASRRAIRRLRGTVFDDAMSRVELHARAEPDPDVPRRYLFGFRPDEEIRFVVDVLKELLWFYVVPDARIATMQHGQQALLQQLFERHVQAVKDGEFRVFPAERADLLREETEERARLRVVADYISGLTDASARRLSERLTTGGDRLHDYL